MTQQWRLETGPCEVVVDAEGWLDAMALGLPQLGLEFGAETRLVVDPLEGGAVLAKDPITGLEILVSPVEGAAPFAMPAPSFDGLAEEPPAPPVALPAGFAAADDAPDWPQAVATSPDETQAPGAVAAPEPPAPSDDDVLEMLFLRLGDIAASTGVASASGVALRILLDLVPAGAGAVLVRTRAGDGLRFRAASGPAATKLVDTVIPLDRGIAGFVCSLGIGVSVADARRDRRHDDRVARSTGYTARSVLAVPIRSDAGAAFGVIELLNPPRPFTPQDLDVAARVGASLGAFLQSVYAAR